MADSFSTTIIEQELEYDFSDATLVDPVAAAIRDAIAAGIRALSAPAAAATIKARDVAARALGRGAGWARDRYTDGAPGATRRAWNDSGELARDLDVTHLGGGAAAVSAPPNRFQGARGAELFARLVDVVPVLRDTLTDPLVVAAIERAAAAMVRVGATTTTKL
jgi:hypothetical protein